MTEKTIEAKHRQLPTAHDNANHMIQQQHYLRQATAVNTRSAYQAATRQFEVFKSRGVGRMTVP